MSQYIYRTSYLSSWPDYTCFRDNNWGKKRVIWTIKTIVRIIIIITQPRKASQKQSRSFILRSSVWLEFSLRDNYTAGVQRCENGDWGSCALWNLRSSYTFTNRSKEHCKQRCHHGQTSQRPPKQLAATSASPSALICIFPATPHKFLKEHTLISS